MVAIVGDTQVGLWVTRSLGRAGLKVFCVGGTERCLSARSRFMSGAWVLESRVSDPAWADELLALARQVNAGSIMPIAESYHLALQRWRGKFEAAGLHLFTPPAEKFARAIDKDAMHRLAGELGIPVARGTTLDRLMAAPSQEKLRFPLVLRAGKQHATGGVEVWKAAYAANEADLARLHEEVRSLAANIIVQEYHPGVEDHVQLLMRGGRAFMAGEYIGEHHMPLAGGVTVQRTSCRHEAVVRDAERLLQALDWEGVAGVQFHLEPATGRYIFLEINPRYIGGLPTVIMAGFDAPFLEWQSRFEPERMRRGNYVLGRRTRILGGDANWVLAMARGDALPPGQARVGRVRAAATFMWHCGPWTWDDVFWWRDPRPAWTDWMVMLRRLRERQRTIDIIGNPESGAGP